MNPWQLAASRLARRTIPALVLDRLRPQPSGGYRPLQGRAPPALADAWKDMRIPARQAPLIHEQLRQMRAGAPPRVFRVLAEAVERTGCVHGSLVEVGCAAGYNAEALSHLLRVRPLNYLGLDYSPAMLRDARRQYPCLWLMLGDAGRLPLADGACDVLISGGVLLHLADYATAIRESARVSRRWVILHRVPVVDDGPTRQFTKSAYGVRCLETAFSERELLAICDACGLWCHEAVDIDRSDWGHDLVVRNRTYRFEKMSAWRRTGMSADMGDAD